MGTSCIKKWQTVSNLPLWIHRPFAPHSITSSADGEQTWREAEAKCLGGVEVDYKLELDRLDDR
jgi:hypothetical protein